MAEGNLRQHHRGARRPARGGGAHRELDPELIRERYRIEIAAALPRWAGKPCRFGIDDCALAIANFDRVVLGRDSARGWRGAYRSQKGALRVMGKGGVLAMARKVAHAQGWRRIARKKLAGTRDGDRGVAFGPAGATCVIRYRGFWISRLDRGNGLATDAQILCAWSIF